MMNIVLLILGFLFVVFILKRFLDRETYKNIRFLVIALILVILVFGIIVILQNGGQK